MIYDLHAFCFKAAPSVWIWELWHGGSCGWNSDDAAADVTDTADDAGAGSEICSRAHGVMRSARTHDKNGFWKKLPVVRSSALTLAFGAPHRARVAELPRHNWIAGFAARRVKGDSGGVSLARGQRHMLRGQGPRRSLHQERDTLHSCLSTITIDKTLFMSSSCFIVCDVTLN